MPRRQSPVAVRRQRLLESIGQAVSRFQDSTSCFDDVAAEVLAIQRGDLPAMTLLLFGGPASATAIATALGLRPAAVQATLERLQLAGYARLRPGDGRQIELSEHARKWIDTIWAPLWTEGRRALATYRTSTLEAMASFLARACEMQERRTAHLREWLAVPSSAARRPHLRGGLPPAALRRVQVFVEANLASPIRLADLARRAGLSPFHFARAFKASAGTTPRAFVEQRRIELAKRLLAGTRLPLADVALECGLGTQSRMTSTFKRLTGVTPGIYRRGRGGVEPGSLA